MTSSPSSRDKAMYNNVRRAIRDALADNEGMTRKLLCSRAGIEYTTLAKFLAGASPGTTLATAWKLSGVLGLSMDDLVGGPYGAQANRAAGPHGIRARAELQGAEERQAS